MKRNLLLCGMVAGPLFVATSLIQAFTRTGFDLARHPISLLGLGSLGWLQIANFVVSGVLYVLGAVGLRAALRSGRGRGWGPLFIGITGVGLIIAGVFTTDPGAGFPPGAPAGAPAMSWHGALHEVGFLLSFVGAIGACLVFARRYAALGHRGWALAAVATVVAALVIAGWPDLNTLSVRLVIATAVLFAFPTAVLARSTSVPQGSPQGETSLRRPHNRRRRHDKEVVTNNIDLSNSMLFVTSFIKEATGRLGNGPLRSSGSHAGHPSGRLPRDGDASAVDLRDALPRTRSDASRLRRSGHSWATPRGGPASITPSQVLASSVCPARPHLLHRSARQVQPDGPRVPRRHRRYRARRPRTLHCPGSPAFAATRRRRGVECAG